VSDLTAETPTGHNVIDGELVVGRGVSTRSVDPRSGDPFGHPASDVDERQLEDAVDAAELAAPTLGRDRDTRARLLDAIADGLDAATDTLVAYADRETALGEPRLRGEVARTSGQLRRFAAVVRDGRYLDVVLDAADPSTTPPRPDLRRWQVPLGPVAVFGASNFPFAFSVAGGDTASALAAGCPVVAKAHPAHPGTSELVARVVADAVWSAGLPAGTFSLVHGADPSVGHALVTEPRIRAVGFTGSTRGGRALFDAAAARETPIPVYAEMGSTNPFVVLPDAIATAGDDIAQALAGSLLQGAGQFCTKPGAVVVPPGDDGDRFVAALAAAVEDGSPHELLTPGISLAFAEGVAPLLDRDDTEVVVRAGREPVGTAQGQVLVQVHADAFLADPALREERFGPFGMVVRADDRQRTEVLTSLEGVLVATLHAGPGDEAQAGQLVELLASIAGRVLVGGVPTGVAVTTAQQHGGPYPATTAPGTTSVGDRAIGRWLRPVAYQDVPETLLPPELWDDNPTGIPRTVDGQLTRDPVVRS
jgi:alpha-ketoglutaric semialdehyde dehydrogenase